MSIDYYAVAREDAALARAFIDGTCEPTTDTIQHKRITLKLRFEVPKFEPFERPSGGVELNWNRDGYIQVIVDSHGVAISHGSGGDRQMATLLKIVELLQAEGLHIWDPQNSSWIPA